MKRTMSVTMSAALGLLVFPALGSAQNFDNIEIRAVPVTENIYMLQGSGGNIGVSIGDDGTIIVDDQFAPLTDKIVAAIAELTDKPVTFVVNSHFHYDHTDGNENFGRAGALIVAQDNSRRRMATDQVLSGSNRPQPAYAEVGLPKITFTESMSFYYNDNTIDIIHTGPGHTDGDAQVYFRDSNVIHTGDMFVRYGLPYIDHGNGGSLDGMIDALWTIAGLIDDNTIIIPGHGQLSTRTDLLEFRAMLVTISDRIKSGIARGLSVDQVIASNPARGYAEPAGSAGWVRTAYEAYR
ncbi:MAG: MBL fold metallo-hydrolase [Gemmatimonadetes bacterium]|nr:MBL fold metallo-hydrolase [Gemmatimonadota bacterium]